MTFAIPGNTLLANKRALLDLLLFDLPLEDGGKWEAMAGLAGVVRSTKTRYDAGLFS